MAGATEVGGTAPDKWTSEWLYSASGPGGTGLRSLPQTGDLVMVIVEIRAAAGGDDAKLLVLDHQRMVGQFAERSGL